MSIDFRSAAAVTGAEKGSSGGPIGALIGAAFGAATAKKPPAPATPWYEKPEYLVALGVAFILTIAVIVRVKRG